MNLRPLRDEDFDVVHAAFVDAFSDYVVPLSPTREQLREMVTRRGWVPEASVGAFDGERMVGFTLNGIDGDEAYDTGTGVVPSHRRRGLAKAMMDFVLPRLNGRRYVLEVLENNPGAVELYQRCGFVERRRLQCWTLADGRRQTADGRRQTADARYETRDLSAVWRLESAVCRLESAVWRLPSAVFDVEPSWQNRPASVARARDKHLVLGNDDGFVVVFPSNGDVPLLAVRPAARRKGLGTALLSAAAETAGKTLRIMNVDDRADGVARFLEACGAKRTVRQIEMVLAGGNRA